MPSFEERIRRLSFSATRVVGPNPATLALMRLVCLEALNQ
jgi:hypothetical protein